MAWITTPPGTTRVRWRLAPRRAADRQLGKRAALQPLAAAGPDLPDLASLSSAVAELFLEDLIALAGQEGADAAALGLAIEAEAAGDGLRDVEEWAAATEQLAAAVCALL